MNEHSTAARSESPEPVKLIYTRTAAGNVADRIAAHRDQVGAICECFDLALSRTIWWPDNGSGASLDRPSFKAMLDYCRQHPRHDGERGEIVVQDPTRLGRPLDPSGSPDLAALAAIVSDFENLGWIFRFTTGAEPCEGSRAFHEALEEITESARRAKHRTSAEVKGGAE